MTTSARLSATTVDQLADELHIDHDRSVVQVGGRTHDMRARAATRDLAIFLYQHWHTRHVLVEAPVAGRSLRDPAMEAELIAATPHRTAPAQAERLPDLDGDDQVLFGFEGLRVCAPRSAVPTAAAQARPGTRFTVQIPSMRPAISPGFFLADSSSGPGHGGQLLRLYVSLLSPAVAPAVWHDLLTAMEHTGLPFRAKVCSHPAQYPRSDALVVYLAAESRGLVPTITAAVDAMDGALGPSSHYAWPLTAGLAAAWEPRDPRQSYTGLSFGQHRSLVVAAAVHGFVHGAEGADLPTVLRGALDRAGVAPGSLARGVDDPHPVELLDPR